MQVEDAVTIEADLGGLLDQKLDRGLVVQYHLRLPGILAFGDLSQLQQTLRFEQRIGVALQTAGIPGQVDQQAAEDLPRIGSGWAHTIRRSPQFEKMLPGFR